MKNFLDLGVIQGVNARLNSFRFNWLGLSSNFQIIFLDQTAEWSLGDTLLEAVIVIVIVIVIMIGIITFVQWCRKRYEEPYSVMYFPLTSSNFTEKTDQLFQHVNIQY